MTPMYVVELGYNIYYVNGSFLGNSTTRNMA